MDTADFDVSRPPFGVGRIIGESFSTFFKKFWKFTGVALVPSLLGLVGLGLAIGFRPALGLEPPAVDPSGFGPAMFGSSLVNLVITCLTTALLILLAYDVKQGRSRPIGAYFSLAASRLLPLLLLSIAAGILVAIGTMLLIVPGLWVLAVFVATYPAILIEGAGFKGLRRSASLTKGYRWPIVGALVVIYICVFAISFAVNFGTGMLVYLSGGMVVVALVVNAVSSAIMYGLGAVMVALIYARLREIKEGVTVGDLAAVFD